MGLACVCVCSQSRENTANRSCQSMSQLSTDPDDYTQGDTPSYNQSDLIGRMVFYNGEIGRIYKRNGGSGQVGLLNPNTGRHIAFPSVGKLRFAIPRINSSYASPSSPYKPRQSSTDTSEEDSDSSCAGHSSQRSSGDSSEDSSSPTLTKRRNTSANIRHTNRESDDMKAEVDILSEYLASLLKVNTTEARRRAFQYRQSQSGLGKMPSPAPKKVLEKQ